MPAALTPQRRNPLRVVAGDIGHLASTVVKLIVAAPRATAGGVERLAGALDDARKRRAAAAYVDACLEEAPRPPPPQPAAFKPPAQPMYGLSPVALNAVNAGRAVATPGGLSASSRPPSALDAAMGSRARASGIPAQPVAYHAPAVSVSSSPPSVLDAAMGARQEVPINAAAPKALSRSSAPPSVLDAALGSRDRAAVATSAAAPPPAAKGRDDYAQAAIKQMQQRATDMDEVAARRREREREAAAAWTSQRERDVTAAQRAAAATRAATRPVVVVDRVAPPRAPVPIVDRRVVATAPQYAAPPVPLVDRRVATTAPRYAAPPVPLVDRRVATATTEYAAPPVVDAAPPVVDAPAPEAPSTTLALSAGGSGIAASLFAQLGGAFLVFMAVMSAPSFSGQMACVAASVVGYQLRALQAFFGVET